ncbi:serine/threonine-protein kinase 33-like [Neodiprion fabricii]|uniref:serine/threonine-protein kinase 33-like n=1 Tax=Neodiprion fabricii TaxID=2872261 RepID=UPI001ED92817|nr:serine/threonine-protein kinase 33-like [Neodiprion fabricii]
MFQKHSSTHSTKLKERDLIHKRITDLAELQRIYEFGEILGKGSFGTVVKASHKGSGLNWAVKIINKSQAGASRIMLVEREIHILKLVDHPNIILLDRVFESPKTIYLIFELCTGSLAKTFKVKKRFEEKETLTVIRSLAGALSYLHKNDIVHRDLKLENILIAANPQNPDDDLHIKVTDFGLSAVRGGTGYETMLHDCCGTLTYMAPEMISTKSYSQQCDVWSMGIIMYVLLVGKFPFYSTNDQHLHMLVKTQELDLSGLSCSEGAKHLLSKMLQKNPAFRMTAAEVENHPWIAGTHSILEAHSSNVLDMMRMWRTEMMETPDRENSNNTEQISRADNSVGLIAAGVQDELTRVAAGRKSSRITLSSEKSAKDSLYSKYKFWESAKPSTAANSNLGRVSETEISAGQTVQDSGPTTTSDVRKDAVGQTVSYVYW